MTFSKRKVRQKKREKIFYYENIVDIYNVFHLNKEENQLQS